MSTLNLNHTKDIIDESSALLLESLLNGLFGGALSHRSRNSGGTILSSEGHESSSEAPEYAVLNPVFVFRGAADISEYRYNDKGRLVKREFHLTGCCLECNFVIEYLGTRGNGFGYNDVTLVFQLDESGATLITYNTDLDQCTMDFCPVFGAHTRFEGAQEKVVHLDLHDISGKQTERHLIRHLNLWLGELVNEVNLYVSNHRAGGNTNQQFHHESKKTRTFRAINGGMVCQS